MSRTKFSSPAEVAAYLQETGVYKVSRRTVYNHIKAGFLKPDGDGLYPFGDVRKYAEAHLQKLAEPAGETGDMNRDLIAAKTARERAQAQRSEFLLQKDRRKYLHIADHTLALAGRWQMLRDDLESLATSAAGDVVEMLGGDQTRIGEVQAYLQGEFRSFLAGFAKARDFEVRMTDEDVTDFLVAFKGQTDAAD